MGIRIVIDSTSDVTDEIIKKYNIKMVPLTVNFENESFLDKVELNSKQFFEKLETSIFAKIPNFSIQRRRASGSAAVGSSTDGKSRLLDFPDRFHRRRIG